MIRAKLVRTDISAKERGDDGVTLPQKELLFQGDLNGAIAEARAIPPNQRQGVRIETEDYFYGPDLFDTMSADAVPLTDFDLIDGTGIVRMEKGALDHLRGDRHLMPPSSIINEQVDVITAILRHKKTIEDVEDLGDRRLVRITAADVVAA